QPYKFTKEFIFHDGLQTTYSVTIRIRTSSQTSFNLPYQLSFSLSRFLFFFSQICGSLSLSLISLSQIWSVHSTHRRPPSPPAATSVCREYQGPEKIVIRRYSDFA
ncbi:hypothetical protein CFOL_v3_20337, partial [Cephalotus follicularis]